MFNATTTCVGVDPTTNQCLMFNTIYEKTEWFILPQVVIILLLVVGLMIYIINLRNPWK